MTDQLIKAIDLIQHTGQGEMGVGGSNKQGEGRFTDLKGRGGSVGVAMGQVGWGKGHQERRKSGGDQGEDEG